MDDRKAVLQKVKQALWQFRTPLVLPDHVDPVAIWEDLLDGDPTLQAYIKDIRMIAIPDGGYTYDIQYMNTQIPPNQVYMVTSQAELCQVMAKAAGRFAERWVAVVHGDVDPQAAETIFHHTTACGYPNLKATSLTVTGMEGSAYRVCMYTYQYRIPREVLIQRDKQVEKKLDELAQMLIDTARPWYVNMYVIFRYLTGHVTYAQEPQTGDAETQSVIQSAYGALIQGSCVCQGMAEAYARLLDRANIICRVVCGHVADGTRHAWNVVQAPDGTWGHHDITWAVMRPCESRAYFHVDDTALQTSRAWDREFVPVCDTAQDLWRSANEYMTR